MAHEDESVSNGTPAGPTEAEPPTPADVAPPPGYSYALFKHGRLDPTPWRASLYLTLAAIIMAIGVCLRTFALLVGHAYFIENLRIRALTDVATVDELPVPVTTFPLGRALIWLKAAAEHPAMRVAFLVGVLVFVLAIVFAQHPHLPTVIRERRLQRWKIVVAAGVTSLIMLGAFWPLPEGASETWFPLQRAAALGGFGWLMWHQRGWLHPLDHVPNRLRMFGHFLIGAMLGALTYSTVRLGLTNLDQLVLQGWWGAGLYNPVAWTQIALHTLLVRLVPILGLTALVVALAAPMRFRRRVGLAILPLLTLAAVHYLALYLRHEAWPRDLGWGQSVDERLPELPVEPDGRLVAVLDRNNDLPIVWPAPAISSMGLPTDTATAERVRAWLAEGGVNTAAARSATIHLFDTAAYDWDTEAQLQVLRDGLHSSSSSPAYHALLLDTLFFSPTTAAGADIVSNLAARDDWWYVYRNSVFRLGEVYQRWGRLQEVLPWVQEQVPHQVDDLLALPVPRRDNVVTGRLLRNGKPWPDAQVGLIEWRLRRALRPRRGPVMPYVQRLIAPAGRTDAQGRFKLDGVVSGRYALVLGLAPGSLVPNERYEALGRFAPVVLSREATAGQTFDAGDINIVSEVVEPPRPTNELTPAAMPGPAMGSSQGL